MSLKICPKCKLISQEKDEKCQECKSELVDIEEYCEKYFVEKSFLSKIKSIFIETKEDKINKEIITIASLQRKISDFNKEFAKLQEDYTFKKDFDKFKDKYKEYKSKLDDLNYIDEIKKINRDFTNEITHFENSFKNMDKKIEDNNLNYLLNEQKNFKEDWEELTKEFIEKPDEFKNKYSSYFEKINDADIGENKDLKEVKEISKNFDSIINEKNIEILKQGCSDFKENYQNLTDHYVEDYDDFKNKYESYFDKINKLNTSTDEFNEINNIYANLDENIKENNEKILENEYSIFEKDWKDLTSNFVNNSSDFESKYETYFERVSKTETNSENLLEVKEIANNFENTINSINELYSTSDETEKLIDELESTTVFIDEDKKTYFKKSFYSLNDNAKQNAHALKYINNSSQTTINLLNDRSINLDGHIKENNIKVLKNDYPDFKKDWEELTTDYVEDYSDFESRYETYFERIKSLKSNDSQLKNAENISNNLEDLIHKSNIEKLEEEFHKFKKDWKKFTNAPITNTKEFKNKYETYFERVSKTETNSENLLEVKEIANNFENTINSINELYSTADEAEKLIDELKSTNVFIDEDKKAYFKKSFYQLNNNAKENIHALKHININSRTTINSMENICKNIDSKINSININILNNEIPQFKKDWKKFTSKYIDNPNTFKEKYQDYHNKISTLTLKGNFKLNLVKKIFSNYNQIIESINVLYKNIETGNKIIYFCEKPNRYLDRRLKKEIKNEMKAIIKIFKTNKKYIENLNKKAQEDITEIKRKNDYIDEYLEKKKEKYVKNELKENKEFFDDFDGKKLDENQRKAVVINEINNQIIAGAGSGKSLTLAAKIKYLIDKKGIDAREILCLTYSNASKNDLKKKVPDEVEVKTFHGLGNSILKEKDPEVYAFDKCFNTFILEKEDITEMVVTFFSKYFNPLVTDAESLGEFYKIEAGRNLETLKSVELKEIYDKEKKLNKEEKTTLKNEIVKSTEELIIANFLYLNGVNYVYEISYPHEDHYKPDFYLTDYDIYLEHFGVDENLDALWIKDKEARQRYKDGIYWKREIHEKNNTKMIETYSYYSINDKLTENLEELLLENGVELNRINVHIFLEKVMNKRTVKQFNDFKNLFKSFINLFKGNNFKKSKFDEFIEESEKEEVLFNKTRTKMFLELASRFYDYYEDYLRKTSKRKMNKDRIDFNDMINLATERVNEQGSSALEYDYKYLIVDEYQDVSLTRTKLLKAIQDATGAKLTVVGDDWQSIYRFTGCDISLFTKFEEYYEKPEILKIVNTYRNSQELIDVSGAFIMQNEHQIPKKLNSQNDSIKKPIKIKRYVKKNEVINVFRDSIKEISSFSNGNILVLGRNGSDINFLKYMGEEDREIFEIHELGHNHYEIIYKPKDYIDIEFRTVHSSKGLEADNVIILNLTTEGAGFPSNVSNDPILRFVVDETDEYENAEERRLFYVGLTRTRNYTYLFAPYTNESVFVTEIKDDINVEDDAKSNDLESLPIIKTNLKCPICETGDVLIRKDTNAEGKYYEQFVCSNRACEWQGGFYNEGISLDTLRFCPHCQGIIYDKMGNGAYSTCSNFPKCQYNPQTGRLRPKQPKETYICPDCGSKLILRDGKYGLFFGCDNFPDCRFSCGVIESQIYKKE